MSSAVGDASRSLDELIAMLKKLRPGELSERQHEILESKAVYAVSTLRSALNTASPVYKLPLEVLGSIFSELVWQMVPQESFIPDLLQVRRRMPQPIHTTSMVSRRWREVALSFPGLWSTVCTCENERMVHIIERSKNTLLRIFVSSIPLRTPDFYQSPSPVTRLLIPTVDTIAPHSNRVQELHLLDISVEELNETSLIQSPLPNLECLTLVMDGDQQLFPLSILANDTPLLKKVTFVHCPFFAAANLRGLTHLCIMSAESLSHVGQIVDVLQALPDLEEFCLAQVRLEHDSTSLHHNKVVLERLRVIGLGAWSRTFPVSDFLQRLLLPSNVELLIWDAHINLTSLSLHTLVPAFITPKELIKELRLTAPHDRRIPRHISRSAIPSLRAPKLCTVVSNPSAFQLDGCFTAGAALLSQIPDSLDLTYVHELWLGQSRCASPLASHHIRPHRIGGRHLRHSPMYKPSYYSNTRSKPFTRSPLVIHGAKKQHGISS